MNRYYINYTNNNLLLFESMRKYSNKELFSYLSKLKIYLNKLNEIDSVRDYEGFVSEYRLLIQYIKNTLTPELSYVGYLTPGDTNNIDVPGGDMGDKRLDGINSGFSSRDDSSDMNFSYAVSLLIMKDKISIAIDRVHLPSFYERAYNVPSVTDVYIQIVSPKNKKSTIYMNIYRSLFASTGRQFNKMISRESISRGEALGYKAPDVYNSVLYVNWVLSRDYYKYVSFSTVDAKDRIIEGYRARLSSEGTDWTSYMWVGLVFLFIVLLIVACIFTGLIVWRMIDRDVTRNEVVNRTEVTQSSPNYV